MEIKGDGNQQQNGAAEFCISMSNIAGCREELSDDFPENYSA
jgi:hypothetical protein